ncbi:unnamed protein product [Symbiodinium sp. CCMP2592]|nr:unnamed protein product [Symbiodinium sp. CCMP2592]
MASSHCDETPAQAETECLHKELDRQADTVSFNAVIDAFAANGDVGKAGSIFLKLTSECNCSRGQDWKILRKCLRKLEFSGRCIITVPILFNSDPVFESFLLRAAMKALSLLDEMSCNGRNTVPTPVSGTQTTQSGDVARADAVLEDMQNRQCSPDLISYNSAMCACAKVEEGGRWLLGFSGGRAQELRREMQQDLLPDLVSFNTILNACARGGDVAEALQVLPQLEGLLQEMHIERAAGGEFTTAMGQFFCLEAPEDTVLGVLAFAGPGLFNALNGLGNAGSSDPSVAALANSCLYCTFAVFGYFGSAFFNLFGPRPLLSIGGLTYAVYAICIYFTAQYKLLAVVGGIVLGVGAGLFWTAQGSLMMAYATPSSRGRLIAVFWVIFNLGGVVGGLLQFALNFQTTGGSANPISYFTFVCVMVSGAALAPVLLAEPSSVVREDGTPVLFEQTESPLAELRAAFSAIADPFVLRNLLFYLASNWFYTYDFNGFNGHQFNVRTRGLNSASFWAAQMLAAWRFGKVLDADGPAKLRARNGMILVCLGLLTSLGWALQDSSSLPCGGHIGWDKGAPCALDFWHDAPHALRPMCVFALLGAADAIYQNYAYWLMSTAAGSNVRKTVMYSAAYKGVQSLGAGMAWLIDLDPRISYRQQGVLCLVLTLGACLPVLGTFPGAERKKEDLTV